MKEEIWKAIPKYQGYEVSSAGLIRSTNKITYTEYSGFRHWKDRVLKQKTDKGGYKRVSLWSDGIQKYWLVHRIVAIAFIPNPENFEIVNHLDGNPSNNNVENLEWTNSKGNVNHAFNNGLMKANKVTLIDKETKKRFCFRSYSKASQFLGKNKGYISFILSQRKTETDGYSIKY